MFNLPSKSDLRELAADTGLDTYVSPYLSDETETNNAADGDNTEHTSSTDEDDAEDTSSTDEDDAEDTSSTDEDDAEDNNTETTDTTESDTLALRLESILYEFAADAGVEEYVSPYLSDESTVTTAAEKEDGVVTAETDGTTITIEVSDSDWDLIGSEYCREIVVTQLEEEVDEIIVLNDGLEYRYTGAGVELLCAANRFIQLLDDSHERLHTTAKTDPLAVVEELQNRVGPVTDIGVEAGLVQMVDRVDSYASALEESIGLPITGYHSKQSVPDGVTLSDTYRLDTGSEVRIYEHPHSVPLYMLSSVDHTLSASDRKTVIDGYEAIAEGKIKGYQTASKAIDYVTDGSYDPKLTEILRKHTQGYGVLEDLFADPRITDVYATSPVSQNPLRVIVDGEQMMTNIHMSPNGAEALSSRVRQTSGRAFSRANPSVDATVDLNNGTTLRVAGVTEPVVEETAFAFRETSDDRFTLPTLVKNGTMSAEVAAFLSVAIERNAAALIAGTRGAGKTTLLGTLLYEIPSDTRTVVIEDTPELPVETLQGVDRDVQPLRTDTGDGSEISTVDALRTALRLGDGALVVGEIRGEEAQVLYEAMRVGANANAVLGTIHGDGAEDVYDRVVHDLNVPPSSFGATDLVVTVQAYRTANGRKRRISSIEGVIAESGEIRFEPLYMIDGDKAVSTGRIARGESIFVDNITGPNETYADIRSLVDERKETIATLAHDGQVNPQEVVDTYAEEDPRR